MNHLCVLVLSECRKPFPLAVTCWKVKRNCSISVPRYMRVYAALARGHQSDIRGPRYPTTGGVTRISDRLSITSRGNHVYRADHYITQLFVLTSIFDASKGDSMLYILNCSLQLFSTCLWNCVYFFHTSRKENFSAFHYRVTAAVFRIINNDSTARFSKFY